MRSMKRRGAWLPLAEIFAVWALVIAWVQINALNASEITAPDEAPQTPRAASEDADGLAAASPAPAASGETQLAAMAAGASEADTAQTSHAGPAASTSGMLTQSLPPALDIAVEAAQAVEIHGLPVSAAHPAIRPANLTAADAASAEPAGESPALPIAPPEEEQEEVPPPADDWVWQTDESGNILARIESLPVQVRVGEIPVNIWGGLSIEDPDSPEAFFSFENLAGQWGSLSLYEDGSWNYVERPDHAPFQKGFSTETFTVHSFDGTQAQIVIRLQYDDIGDLMAG